jgi:hypothetical protein
VEWLSSRRKPGTSRELGVIIRRKNHPKKIQEIEVVAAAVVAVLVDADAEEEPVEVRSDGRPTPI